jgi:hypothetical protein
VATQGSSHTSHKTLTSAGVHTWGRFSVVAIAGLSSLEAGQPAM